MTNVTLALAQINPLVGDIPSNTQKVLAQARYAQEQFGADAILFPELVLSGYPPEDLLLRPSMGLRVECALEEIKAANLGITLILGYPRVIDGQMFNMAGVIRGSTLVCEYAKQCLPNVQVFDEVRYFAPGDRAVVFDLNGIPTALSVCEDIWHPGPMEQARAAGARLMLNLNALPFHRGKPHQWEKVVAERARQGQMPVVCVNQVGAQDELVFDGGSLAIDAAGDLCQRLPLFEEATVAVSLQWHESTARLVRQELTPPMTDLACVYQALVLGLRDYVGKNGFKGVVLGLSGGIDSALTLALAVDALGPERVSTVMMPFRYTSEQSIADAAEQAQRMGVSYLAIGIEPMYNAFMSALENEFVGTTNDTTEENLQARCRGVILMAISNKKGVLVLTTGNKSELAVGYSTLYGDMAGGFDALKDVSKTLVFELARYRNRVGEVIPPGVISRPPSAELAPDQTDQDNLPPYDILDPILALYVEQDRSAEEIIAQGFERAVVERIIRLVDMNEYKRRQAPVGVRITERSFGRDRRYPITSGWRLGG